jgi:hypothetical protein
VITSGSAWKIAAAFASGHVCDRRQEGQRSPDLADHAHADRPDHQRAPRPQRAAPGGEGRDQHHGEQAAHQNDLADAVFSRHRLGDGVVQRKARHGCRHQQAAANVGVGVQNGIRK